jgi:hypothetical protein
MTLSRRERFRPSPSTKELSQGYGLLLARSLLCYVISYHSNSRHISARMKTRESASLYWPCWSHRHDFCDGHWTCGLWQPSCHKSRGQTNPSFHSLHRTDPLGGVGRVLSMVRWGTSLSLPLFYSGHYCTSRR